jgi:DNA-binding beta-propeller fold protein YncE
LTKVNPRPDFQLRGLMAAGWIFVVCLGTGIGRGESHAAERAPLSPTALAATPDGSTLFIAGATANSIAVFDLKAGSIRGNIAVPASPSGVVVSRDGSRLYVTCAAPASTVCVVDIAAGRVMARIPTGHTAMSPVLSPDGAMLYVCNRFDSEISFNDLRRSEEAGRIAVAREPISLALTPDGKFLLAAHHLHNGRANADYVAASVSVIETATRKVVKEIGLPNGSGLLREVSISPDGKWACVTHQVSRFHLPTTQLERGWINTNALTVIDLTQRERLNTVLLDNVNRGAANPWAVAWSGDGKWICVTHAGTHEVSVIDSAALLEKLARCSSSANGTGTSVDYTAVPPVAEVPNDLAFLVGLRQRISLGGGVGPRAVTFVGSKAYVANYFSDSLNVIELPTRSTRASSIPLGPPREMSVVRKGEMLWNDGSICFQGWQSCSSCHSSDARVDGLNWDNLNDGIGNPKNAKSLLFAHRTPPSMWTGVREDAPTAVRAGIKHILFTVRPEEDAVALDRYLESLRPIPSPRLVNGKLSAAARRGQTLFNSEATGCAQCHSGELFTDLKSHDVGTAGEFDLADEPFDTPTLIELWRSAPYLHDGSAATMIDVLSSGNPANKHGNTRHLTPAARSDLAEYLLSL